MFEDIVGHERQKSWLQNLMKAGTTQPVWLSGPKGVGKSKLAKELALGYWGVNLPPDPSQRTEAIMGPDDYAQYLKWKDNNHPDLKILYTKRPGINEIRDWLTDVELHPYEQTCKVYILNNINYTTAVYQVLLKILEEGVRKYCRFVLITHHRTIPATIKSRCIDITLEKLTDDQVNTVIRQGKPMTDDIKELVSLCNGSVGDWMKMVQSNQMKEVTKRAENLIEDLKRSNWTNIESEITYINSHGLTEWVLRWLSNKLITRYRSGIKSIGACPIHACLRGFDRIISTEGIDRDRVVRSFIVEVSNARPS